jgi:glycosyltransferase involved in cell wall biosynthesis
MSIISFVIPTYNAGQYLQSCLKSIQGQEYPQDKVEILILDGGSSDNTLEIAHQHNCRVLKNEKKLAEYGVQLGMENTKGDLAVVFAADNELVGTKWIQKIVEIFERDEEISAVWGRLISGEDDSALNKYFELIQSDPLNWFLNKNLDKYKKQAEFSKDDCLKFRVNPERPLVWGANGLVYRTSRIKSIWLQDGYLGDNDAFQYMVEAGNNKVAYFDSPFIYHHHVAKLSDWIKRWKRNLLLHLLDKKNTRNMNWVFTADFKIKLLIWIIYSAIPIFSLSHAGYLSLRDKNIYWRYHPIASFAQFLTYSFLLASTSKGHDFLKSFIFGIKERV